MQPAAYAAVDASLNGDISPLVCNLRSGDISNIDVLLACVLVAARRGHFRTVEVLLDHALRYFRFVDFRDLAKAVADTQDARCVRIVASFDYNATVDTFTLADWMLYRSFTTVLHYAGIIHPFRALQQLRGGANIRHAARVGAFTPLALARLKCGGRGPAMEKRRVPKFCDLLMTRGFEIHFKDCGDISASLVLYAAEPWSPQTHCLFPGAMRREAWDKLLLGMLLSLRFKGAETAFRDIWIDFVLPRAINRGKREDVHA